MGVELKAFDMYRRFLLLKPQFKFGLLIVQIY